MKKVLKVLGWIIVSPILLFLVLAVLLYIPPIQNFVVNKAMQVASDATGMDIRVKKLRLKFPLDIDLRGVQILHETGDTLVSVNDVVVDLDFRKLLHAEVGVNALEINSVSLDTRDLIDGVSIQGRLGRFFVDSHGVRPFQGTVIINNCELADTDLAVVLHEVEEQPDTTESAPVDWTIALQRVALNNARMQLSMSGDSMRVALNLSRALLNNGLVDLGKAYYAADAFDFHADTLAYDLPYTPETTGLDVNHLQFTNVGIQVDSLRLAMSPLTLSMALNRVTLSEKCGLKIDSLGGYVTMDSARVQALDWVLHTPNSQMNITAETDFSAFQPGGYGRMTVRADAMLGKADLLLLGGELPPDFVRGYPAGPLALKLRAEGNIDTLQVTRLQGRLATAFELEGTAGLYHVTDSVRRQAEANLQVQTGNLNFVKGLAGPGAMDGIAFPPLNLDAGLAMKGNTYKADLRLREGQTGRVALNAFFDADREKYHADLVVDSLQLHDFIPDDSLYHLAARVEIDGTGLDVMKRSTRMKVQAAVTTLEWGKLNFGGVNLNAQIERGQGQLQFNSDNELLQLHSHCNASLVPDNVGLTFGLDLKRIDLYALQLVKNPFSVAMALHLEGGTNLKDRHKIQGGMTDIRLMARDTVFHPKNVTLDVLMRPDSLYAYVQAGDLLLNASGRNSLDNILTQAGEFVDEFNAQIAQGRIRHDVLRACLPDVSLFIYSGKDNPVSNIMAAQGYRVQRIEIAMNADAHVGLKGEGCIYSLNTGAMLLDTIQWHISQDTTGINLDGRVRNGPKNKQFVFDTRMKAYVRDGAAGVDVRYVDGQGEEGVNFGIRGDLEEKGLRVHFVPERPVIAYRNFQLNKDNYIFLGNDRRVEADVDLLADDGTGVKLYSTLNEDALQDITLAINRLNLDELTSVMPYAPRITGFLYGDVHLLQTAENLSVMTDTYVQDMVYEEAPIGKVGLNAVYLPNADGSHYVDAIVALNDQERLTLSGKYADTETGGEIDAQMDVADLPLALANGFIDAELAQLSGTMAGGVQVNGSVDRPVVNGGISLKNVRVKSTAYSLNLRVQDDTIRVDNNKLTIDALKIFSLNKNPLVMRGTVDFRNMDRITLDAGIKSVNFELINAPRSKQAAAYGKVYVDVNTTLKGTLDNLAVRGRLNVLGNTDVTYVLKDSPLTVENRLSDLVEFVDFSDSTGVAEERVSRPLRLDAVLVLSIDQAAQVHCMLNADHSNYVELEGGGDLTMTYSPDGELLLNGRYTVLSGEMKYSLPVIPLKTFTLKNGSYVEFVGDPANPTLNISAVERVRATVTENEVPRTVSFDVGLSITQNLDNMGLEFTLDTPEDMTIRNELAAMSQEQRGRLAVTMLATGMYLADGNLGGGGGFSTQSALNAFLQSEINTIAGNALKTIDLSVGMENTMMADGSTQTDYSFRFAKRFWGNRVSLIIGGKVSTGEDVENTGQTLIDNVSLEYRLDKSATRYVKLFYDKSYESILEGELTEMGAGLVLRRKMTKLGELFIFRRNRKTQNMENLNN